MKTPPPPRLIPRLQALAEGGGSVFGVLVQNHGSHKYVTVWAFPEDGSVNAVGLNDLALKNPMDLYDGVGKLIVRLAEGLDPKTGEALNPPPEPPNLSLITEDNDNDV